MRRLWSGVVFSVGLAAFLLGSVRGASACTPPPSGWFPSGVAPTPANGVVLLGYGCYSGCDTPPAVEELVLKGEGDTPVAGSVIFSQLSGSRLDIAFRPEPGAVTEGRVYKAELGGLPTLSGILVGPAVTWNDALMPTEEVFEADHPTGDAKCCEGPVDPCGNTPCFRAQVARRTAVTVGWYDALSIEHYQYVFRLGRETIDPAAPWSWDGGDARFELDETEDVACYVLELKRLADASVQSFASRCVTQPGAFAPGLHPTPGEDVAAVLQACDEPPAGYENAWCEARGELCELSPDEPWCPAFVARCATLGDGGTAGEPSAAGGPSGAGGVGGVGGVGTAGRGGATGSSGTESTAGGRGGAGSSGAQGGTAGGVAAGGATPVVSGTGGTADDQSGGDGGAVASSSRTVLTKAGCGCRVPGGRPDEPAVLVFALGLIALQVRRATKSAGGARV